MMYKHWRLVVYLLLAHLISVGTVAAQEQIQVVINTIAADPIPNETAYQVRAYITVTNSEGQPISDLSPAAFEISQDGELVTLDSVAVTQRPVSVMLVIDTSGSMASEGKIDAVKAAATSFINGLAEDDQIGVIYFNDTINIAQTISDDHRAALTIIDLLEAKDGSGTCLYDAAYEAVESASAAQAGQRAVILLTDGIDELPDRGGQCSTHTVNEMIDLANERSTRVPIYTIGVGQRIDAAELAGIADETGGVPFFGGSETVDLLFDTIGQQLKNQYELIYRTQTTVGEHSLTATITAGSASGVTTRAFIAPELPPVLNLTGLDNEAILEGSRTVRATISGRGIIDHVTFLIDGETLAETTESPFEITLDKNTLAPGPHRLMAEAVLADGSQLSSVISFEVQAAPLPEVDDNAQESVDEADTTLSEEDSDAARSARFPGWVLIPAGVVVLAAVVISMVLVMRRQPQAVKGTIVGGGVDQDYTGKKTIRSSTGVEGFGTLHIERSLSLNRGQKFELHKDVIRIGRGADNDVIIPDAPVSRHQAEIRLSPEGHRYVVDLDSRYGTFVNDQQVGPDGLPIEDGDTLQLGTRTFTRYETAFKPYMAGAEDATLDVGSGDLAVEPEFSTQPLDKDQIAEELKKIPERTRQEIDPEQTKLEEGLDDQRTPVEDIFTYPEALIEDADDPFKPSQGKETLPGLHPDYDDEAEEDSGSTQPL